MSGEVIAAMLRIASQDLDGAHMLNQAGNRNAAYLCEQAAEKVIRAVLTSEGIQALDADISKVGAAPSAAVTAFQVDLASADVPAGRPRPIR